MLLKEYPGIGKLTWEEDVKVTCSEILNYGISIDKFKEMLNAFLDLAVQKNSKYWLSDSTKTIGFISEEMGVWLQKEWIPLAQNKGVKGFVTIVPKSAITQLSHESLQSEGAFVSINVGSMEEAKKWIRENG